MVNSRQALFSATYPSSSRGGIHRGRPPFSRSYGGNLPSSLGRVNPRPLALCVPAHLCRFAVRSPALQRPRGCFSSVCSGPFPRPEGRSSLLPLRLGAGICLGPSSPYRFGGGIPSPPGPFAPASPLGLHAGGGGLLTPLPIGYAFRPRLRDRLTHRGRTCRWKPWAYGEGDSHPLNRY